MMDNKARTDLALLQRTLLLHFLLVFLVGGPSIIARADILYSTNFENFTAKNLQGWSIDNGVWSVGTPNTGPGAAHEGLQCAGTGINDNYPVNTSSRLISPQIDLPALASGQQILLRFWQWFSWDTTTNNSGYGQVQVSTWDGSQWGPWNTASATYNSGSNGWHYAGTNYVPIDLSAYAGRRLRIGFLHYGGGNQAPGWFIDELSVTKEAVVDMPLNTPVTFEDFTSTNWKGWLNDNGVWDVGTPNSGPTAAHEGSQCAGTGINGNYPINTSSRLGSAPFTLPTIKTGQQILLRFWQWFSWDTTTNNSGYGQVQVSTWNGSQWGPWNTLSSTYSSSSNDWHYAGTNYVPIDLSTYAGRRIRLGFLHYGGGNQAPGWFIDQLSVNIEAIVDMPLNTPVTFEDFTSTNWKGWLNNNGVWDVGTPNTGPGAAHEGSQCAGTGINGNYPINTSSLLASAPFTLPTIATGQQITLRFWQWFNWDTTTNNSGYGQVYVSTLNSSQWGPWNAVGPQYNGYNGIWQYVGTDYAPTDLSSYAGRRIRLGFLHYGGGNPDPGWYIDQVIVGIAAPTITDFTPKKGPAGTTVTVTGKHFTGITSVLFNGASASFKVVSDSTITAVVPPSATTGGITIVSPGGTATTATTFVVLGINVTLLPTTVIGGINNSTGIVTLATKAPSGGTKVNLISSNTAAATVPASVTVAAGKTSAAFTVISRAVTVTKTVLITATAGTSSSATLTVQPLPVGTLTLVPSTVAGGENSIGILTLTKVASTATTVTLKSSNTKLATVSATFVIPANTNMAIFNIDTNTVRIATSVTITATINGQSLTALLSITP